MTYSQMKNFAVALISMQAYAVLAIDLKQEMDDTSISVSGNKQWTGDDEPITINVFGETNLFLGADQSGWSNLKNANLNKKELDFELKHKNFAQV